MSDSTKLGDVVEHPCAPEELTERLLQPYTQDQSRRIFLEFQASREIDRLRARNAELERERNLFRTITDEVKRATDKFPSWPTDPLHALAVLGEEFGELTQAMLQHTYEPHKSTRKDVREEAVQTAAMALRLVTSLDEYEYQPGQQHRQPALARTEDGSDGD